VTEPGISISPAATIQAGQVLADASDTAASAGSSFLSGREMITGAPQAGLSIGPAASAFGEAFGKVCADLVESATGLGELVQSSAQLYGTTDSAVTNRFGGMVPR
jgi:hypothetical protein